MLSYRTILLLMLLLLTPAFAQGPIEQEPPMYTEAQFREAAAQLRENPLGDKGEEASKTVITWTVQSELVDIVIGPPVMAIMEKGETQYEMALISAFAAGQAVAQLNAKQKGGFALEGGKEVIRVYQQISKQDPAYRNPAVEEMIEANKKGELGGLLVPLRR